MNDTDRADLSDEAHGLLNRLREAGSTGLDMAFDHVDRVAADELIAAGLASKTVVPCGDVCQCENDILRAVGAQPSLPDATVYGALLSAAQTGQVLYGEYATTSIVDELVAAGLGTHLTDPFVPSKLIGFVINDKGREAARRHRAAGTPVPGAVEGNDPVSTGSRTVRVTMALTIDDRDGKAVFSTSQGELGSMDRATFLAAVAEEFGVTITPAGALTLTQGDANEQLRHVGEQIADVLARAERALADPTHDRQLVLEELMRGVGMVVSSNTGVKTTGFGEWLLYRAYHEDSRGVAPTEWEVLGLGSLEGVPLDDVNGAKCAAVDALAARGYLVTSWETKRDTETPWVFGEPEPDQYVARCESTEPPF